MVEAETGKETRNNCVEGTTQLESASGEVSVGMSTGVLSVESTIMGPSIVSGGGTQDSIASRGMVTKEARLMPAPAILIDKKKIYPVQILLC